MFGRSGRLFLFFLMFAVAVQGCSSDSGSSNPAGPGDGDDDVGGWSTQLVKSGNFANGEINVSVDAGGKLYISAFDFNTGLLCLTNKSGTWISTVIDDDFENAAGAQNDIVVDGLAKVHTVYSHFGGITYATDESGSWSYQDMWLSSLGSCCIAADGDGNLHLAFDDGVNSDIRYAFKSAGGAWGTPVALADEWINSDCDMDVDGSNNPHVVFNFSAHHTLRYASFNGTWSVSTVEGSDSYPYDPDTGWTPAIAVNKSTDVANIVFWNSSANSVQFSNGAVNSAVTLKDTAGWAKPCIALESDGYAHVFFGEYGTNILNYATNRSGSWVNTVLSIEVGSTDLAVVIDAGNMIHVIYTIKTALDLHHASLQL